jgi:hypothetical protein
MEKHITKVCQASYAHLRIISRLRHSLDFRTCMCLVQSLAVSRVEFGLALLHGCSDKAIRKLQRVIDACTRIAETCKVNFSSNNTNQHPYLWLTVRQRIFLRLAMITYTAIKMSTPTYLADMLVRFHAQHPCGLRSSHQQLLGTIRTRTELGKRAFMISSSKIWNSLPSTCREAGSRASFRTLVIDYLVNIDMK